MGQHKIMDEEWQLLSTFLPENWQEMAHTHGAIKRKRGVTEPDALLRLLFLHVATGLSLRQAVARATILGWPSMSDVALLKRLRSSGSWLQAMAAEMYATSRFHSIMPESSRGRNIRAVDATTIVEPGATGTSWRVHYSINLPKVECDYYEVTDAKGGESLKRFPTSEGDLILGDRVYGNRAGVVHVIRSGGDVVVRLNSTSFPLLERVGRKFALLDHLRTLDTHHPGEWKVSFMFEEKVYSARLCAVRKSREASEAAKLRILRDSRRKQGNLRPETTEHAEYVVVLTTLPAGEYSATQVLALYRLRWQIELVFKRLKSLMQLGHVPKTNDQSARAWIQAKLLVALIIERLSDEARFFSPWGFMLMP
jgi:transposase